MFHGTSYKWNGCEWGRRRTRWEGGEMGIKNGKEDGKVDVNKVEIKSLERIQMRKEWLSCAETSHVPFYSQYNPRKQFLYYPIL